MKLNINICTKDDTFSKGQIDKTMGTIESLTALSNVLILIIIIVLFITSFNWYSYYNNKLGKYLDEKFSINL